MKVRPISQLWMVLGLIPRRRARLTLDIPLASRDWRNNLPNSNFMFFDMIGGLYHSQKKNLNRAKK
jgi:hypothetical protein